MKKFSFYWGYTSVEEKGNLQIAHIFSTDGWGCKEVCRLYISSDKEGLYSSVKIVPLWESKYIISRRRAALASALLQWVTLSTKFVVPTTDVDKVVFDISRLVNY